MHHYHHASQGTAVWTQLSTFCLPCSHPTPSMYLLHPPRLTQDSLYLYAACCTQVTFDKTLGNVAMLSVKPDLVSITQATQVG